MNHETLLSMANNLRIYLLLAVEGHCPTNESESNRHFAVKLMKNICVAAHHHQLFLDAFLPFQSKYFKSVLTIRRPPPKLVSNRLELLMKGASDYFSTLDAGLFWFASENLLGGEIEWKCRGELSRLSDLAKWLDNTKAWIEWDALIDVLQGDWQNWHDKYSAEWPKSHELQEEILSLDASHFAPSTTDASLSCAESANFHCNGPKHRSWFVDGVAINSKPIPPLPFKLMKVLWDNNREIKGESLIASEVYEDANELVDLTNLRNIATDANHFFKDHSIAWRVKVCGKQGIPLRLQLVASEE